MTTAAIDPLALIAEMAQTPKKGKAKSEKPEVTEPALDAAVSRWIEANAEVKKWEGIRTTTEAQILAFATPARLAECRRLGAVESTVRVNGKLNVTQKCQYATVPCQHLPALQEAFGAEAARYFKPRTKLELTEAATGNSALLARLIEALGAETFAASFSVKQFAEVTEAFHHDFTLQPAVEAKARPFLDLEVIKPYKPSLRQ